MIRQLGTVAIFSSLLACQADAQGDAEAGRQLALTWCTACHVVDVEGRGADVGPALPLVFADGARTPDQIRGWLADPHPPMPKFDLTRQEIDDIVAYLQTMTAP